jgi:hypothetical protein
MSITKSTIAALTIALTAAGCQTTAQQTDDDPMGWARFDCQRGAGVPKLETELERAKLICIGRADAASIAGTANIRPGYGVGGAVVSGIETGVKQSQISNATIISCMAEQGYHAIKRSEFEALCPVSSPKPARKPL